MKCKTHIWDFHAEMTDGTIVRWCGQCGGLQAFSKGGAQKPGLGLDQVGFTKYAPTEVRLPENVKDDDGLFSEGIIDRDLQPELRSTHPINWLHTTRFQNPWTPDDDGQMVEELPVQEAEFVMSDALRELLTLSGVAVPSEEKETDGK